MTPRQPAAREAYENATPKGASPPSVVAGPWPRLTAFVLDVSLWAVVMVACLHTLLNAQARGVLGDHFWTILLVSEFLLWSLVFSVLQSGKRTSPGQWCAGIWLRTEQARPLPWLACFWRQILFRILNAVWLVGFLCSLPVLWCRRTPVDWGSRSVPVTLVKRSVPVLAVGWVAAAACLAVARTGLPIHGVEGPAMEPGLVGGQKVLVNPHAMALNGVQLRDMVVITMSDAVQDKTLTGSGQRIYVRRCAGRPGDRVEVRRNQLFVNGTLVTEPYAGYSVAPMPGALKIAAFDLKVVGGQVYVRNYEVGGRRFGWYGTRTGQIVQDQERIERSQSEPLPPDHVLVLGDNRFLATDSRVWGLVPITRIIGPALVVPGLVLGAG